MDQPYQHDLPALEGFRLAILKNEDAGTSPVEIEVDELDTGGDPTQAMDLARQIAADPSYVLVVAAPFWAEPDAVRTYLDARGLTTLGLSTLGAPAAAGGSLPLVAPLDIQVKALRPYLLGPLGHLLGPLGPVCLVTDGTVYGTAIARGMRQMLGTQVALVATLSNEPSDIGALVTRIRTSGCPTVGWAGFDTGAAALRIALSESGLGHVAIVGADAMKTNEYLTTSGAGGEGTLVSCSCVDLSFSTALKTQVFIHDYQSEFGTPPGLYAAEGYDAGGMFLAALAGGASTHGGVRAALADERTYRGIATTYSFDPRGELEGARARVGLFIDRAGRWISVG